jgi:hypothetical protein
MIMRHLIATTFSVLVFAIACSNPGKAYAQDAPVMDWSFVGWNAVNASIGEEIVAPDRQRLRAASQPKVQSAISAPNFSYRFSSVRSRTNLANFVAKIRQTDPQGAAQLERFFAGTDFMGEVDRELQGLGLRSDNLSHCYALWWVTAWKVSKADLTETTPQIYAAVAAQARDGFLRSGALNNTNDAQKQELAQSLLIQAGLLDASAQANATNPTMMAALSRAAISGARASGLRIDTMVLTPTGFRQTRG